MQNRVLAILIRGCAERDRLPRRRQRQVRHQPRRGPSRLVGLRRLQASRQLTRGSEKAQFAVAERGDADLLAGINRPAQQLLDSGLKGGGSSLAF
jgi:hypothetical protein